MSESAISILRPDPKRVWRDESAKSVSFFCKRRPVRVDRGLLSELMEYAGTHNGCDVRLCLHDSPEALHHDMVIVSHRRNYYRPHKHLAKGEAFQMIEGRMATIVFGDGGDILDACILEAGEIYRVEIDMYHAILPLSEIVMFHENKPGPFLKKDDSIFASWSPDGQDRAAVESYKRGVEKSVGAHGE